jgi:hypothetical protein
MLFASLKDVDQMFRAASSKLPGLTPSSAVIHLSNQTRTNMRALPGKYRHFQ